LITHYTNKSVIFADSFGPEGYFVEDEYRIFVSLSSSPFPKFNQAGSEKISTWLYRAPLFIKPIDPERAFVEIKSTYKIIIEGKS